MEIGKYLFPRKEKNEDSEKERSKLTVYFTHNVQR